MSILLYTVEEVLVNGLESMIACGYEPYAYDLAQDLYDDEHYTHYDSTKVATAELDTWECIRAVQLYEQNACGEVFTPLSDACRVANALIRIIGNELLQAIYGKTVYFDEKWNDRLTTKDLRKMLEMAEAWLQHHPDGLNDIWLSLPTK